MQRYFAQYRVARHRKLHALGAALLLAMMGGTGMAQLDAGINDDEVFRRADVNEDGFLSGAEVRGFEKCDADRNGEISKQEFLRQRAIERGDAGNMQQARARAESLFKQKDGNNDGWLSGTEMVGFAQYDLNGDARITLDEFVAGMTGQQGSVPVPPNPAPPAMPGAPVAFDPPVLPTSSIGPRLGLLIEAIKTTDPRPFLAEFHPDLADQVDEPVLEQYLRALKNALGEPVVPGQSQLTITTDDERLATVTTSVDLKFSKGSAPCKVASRQGKIMSFAIDGPDVTEAIYKSLSDDRDLAGDFATFYTPDCEALVRDIQSGQDEAALDCFHPEIRKQIAGESTRALFAKFREDFGRLTRLSLQGLTVNYKDAKPESFQIQFQATCAKKIAVVTVTFQFVGMKAWITDYRAEEATA